MSKLDYYRKNFTKHNCQYNCQTITILLSAVKKSIYPDIMEDHQITYIGEDCDEHLANPITEREDELEGILNLDIIMDCYISYMLLCEETPVEKYRS